MNSFSDSTSRQCSNCGTPMLGDHCYACGQPVKGLVRHFGSIVGDFFDSVFDFDARLPRTLGPLLLQPGRLSLEYFSGHRVRYVSPVRLFVFLCIVAFFALNLTLDSQIDPISDDNSSLSKAETVAEVERIRGEVLKDLNTTMQELDGGPGSSGVRAGIAAINREADRRVTWLKARDKALERGEPPPEPPVRAGFSIDGAPWHAQDNPAKFDWLSESGNATLNTWIGRGQENLDRVKNDPALLKDAFLSSLPQTFFVLLPLFALLLKLSYLFKRRLYMEHLIVALHSHAFLCIAVLLLVVLEQIGSWLEPDSWPTEALDWLELIIGLWMPIYLWLMQKRVYGQGVIMTSIKFAIIGLFYMVLLLIGATLNLMFNLVTL